MAGLRMPLSLDDMRTITAVLEKWEPQLVNEDGEYTALGDLVLRIEIARPETDDIVGHITLQDGWVGFMPIEADRS